jgi:hypothetical protein
MLRLDGTPRTYTMPSYIHNLEIKKIASRKIYRKMQFPQLKAVGKIR